MQYQCLGCAQPNPSFVCACFVAKFCSEKCRKESNYKHSRYHCLVYSYSKNIALENLLFYQSSSTYGPKAEKLLLEKTEEYLKIIKGDDKEDENIPNQTFYCKDILEKILKHVSRIPPWQRRDICEFYKKPWTCSDPEALIRDLSLDFVLLPGFSTSMHMEILFRAAWCGRYKRYRIMKDDLYAAGVTDTIGIIEHTTLEERRLIATYLEIGANIHDPSDVASCIIDLGIFKKTESLKKQIDAIRKIIQYATE